MHGYFRPMHDKLLSMRGMFWVTRPVADALRDRELGNASCHERGSGVKFIMRILSSQHCKLVRCAI